MSTQELVTPPPMDDHQVKALIKRFFAHKEKGSRLTQLLRNLITRSYLTGYEQAVQDLKKQNQID